MRWNPCFEEGRDAKLGALRLPWVQADAAARAPTLLSFTQ
jgi:hypothetical protein